MRLLSFILVPCLLTIQACAVGGQRESFSGSSLPTPSNAEVTGLWEGTAISGCDFMQTERTRCHAVVNIALTMTQHDSTVRGSYSAGREPHIGTKLASASPSVQAIRTLRRAGFQDTHSLERMGQEIAWLVENEGVGISARFTRLRLDRESVRFKHLERTGCFEVASSPAFVLYQDEAPSPISSSHSAARAYRWRFGRAAPFGPANSAAGV